MNIKSNKIVLAVIAVLLSLLTCMTNGNIILCGIDVKHRIWQIAKPMPSSIIILLLTLCSKVKVELAQCNSVRATSAKCRMK